MFNEVGSMTTFPKNTQELHLAFYTTEYTGSRRAIFWGVFLPFSDITKLPKRVCEQIRTMQHFYTDMHDRINSFHSRELNVFHVPTMPT